MADHETDELTQAEARCIAESIDGAGDDEQVDAAALADSILGGDA